MDLARITEWPSDEGKASRPVTRRPTDQYRVVWETDIFAAVDPVDAARQARAMQTRPGTIATVFTVIKDETEWVVDLWTEQHVTVTESGP